MRKKIYKRSLDILLIFLLIFIITFGIINILKKNNYKKTNNISEERYNSLLVRYQDLKHAEYQQINFEGLSLAKAFNTTELDSIKLKKKQEILIAFSSGYYCTCSEYLLAYLNDSSFNQNFVKTLIIQKYNTERERKLLKQRFANLDFMEIQIGESSIIDNLGDQYCIGIVSKETNLINAFIPLKHEKQRTKDYLNVIKKKLY